MVDVASIVIGLVSLLIGIYGALMAYIAHKKSKALKSLTFEDLEKSAKYIWKKLQKEDFIPDIMISPDPKGGIVAFLLSQLFDNNSLLHIGNAVRLEPGSAAPATDGEYLIIQTNRWLVLLSNQILNTRESSSKKVLIVDDFVLSGDFNTLLIKTLVNNGYNTENIKVCCAAVTNVAIQSKKEPDVYWKVVNDDDFFLPWGKAE